MGIDKKAKGWDALFLLSPFFKIQSLLEWLQNPPRLLRIRHPPHHQPPQRAPLLRRLPPFLRFLLGPQECPYLPPYHSRWRGKGQGRKSKINNSDIHDLVVAADSNWPPLAAHHDLSNSFHHFSPTNLDDPNYPTTPNLLNIFPFPSRLPLQKLPPTGFLASLGLLGDLAPNGSSSSSIYDPLLPLNLPLLPLSLHPFNLHPASWI